MNRFSNTELLEICLGLMAATGALLFFAYSLYTQGGC